MLGCVVSVVVCCLLLCLSLHWLTTRQQTSQFSEDYSRDPQKVRYFGMAPSCSKLIPGRRTKDTLGWNGSKLELRVAHNAPKIYRGLTKGILRWNGPYLLQILPSGGPQGELPCNGSF